MSSFETDLNRYITTPSAQSMEDDPFEFWLLNMTVFPNLSNIILDLLSVPASSTPIERVFSVGEEATTGKRNRLCDNNFEQEMLMRMNDLYLL